MLEFAGGDHVVDRTRANRQLVRGLEDPQQQLHAACSRRLGCRPAIVLPHCYLRRHRAAPVAGDRQQRAHACTDVIVPPIYFFIGRNPFAFSPHSAHSFWWVFHRRPRPAPRPGCPPPPASRGATASPPGRPPLRLCSKPLEPSNETPPPRCISSSLLIPFLHQSELT